MTQKVFLLGVGAQKCGTSWLHDVLCQSAQADMGFSKEYHIHDALTLPECARFGGPTLKRLQSLTAKGTPPQPDSKLFLRAQFLTNPTAYYEYFQDRLDDPSVMLTGDFTPSYSGLSVQTLNDIKTQMRAHGIRTKVVFLMRDPVERSWSALRMSRRQTMKKNPNYTFEQNEFDQLRANYKKPSFEMRANYSATLSRLEQVFEPEDIFVEFYERLIAEDVVDHLCGFTGIAPFDADLSAQINVSPKTSDIPQELAREMARHYGDIYRDLATRFGADTIKELWWSAQFVLSPALSFRTI